MSALIDLYYWPTPNGWKITIALEEMGLDYKMHLIDIGKGAQFDPDFLEIAPNNRMPAITDPEGPDGEPISIILLNSFGKLTPFGDSNRLRSWMLGQG